MPLDESFYFQTFHRDASENVDYTVYYAERTLEGYSVKLNKGCVKGSVDLPYNMVIGFLNDAEWVVWHEKE